jgi:hypothetical protein
MNKQQGANSCSARLLQVTATAPDAKQFPIVALHPPYSLMLLFSGKAGGVDTIEQN